MALAGFHVQIQGLYTTWIYTPWLYIEHMARGYRLILLGRFSPPESQWMSPNIRPNNIYLKKTQTCLSKFIDLLIHYSAPHLYISCLRAYLCDAFIYLSITLCIYMYKVWNHFYPCRYSYLFIFIYLSLCTHPIAHGITSPASGRPTTLALAPSSSTDLSSSSACLVPQIQRQGDACKILWDTFVSRKFSQNGTFWSHTHTHTKYICVHIYIYTYTVSRSACFLRRNLRCCLLKRWIGRRPSAHRSHCSSMAQMAMEFEGTLWLWLTVCYWKWP